MRPDERYADLDLMANPNLKPYPRLVGLRRKAWLFLARTLSMKVTCTPLTLGLASKEPCEMGEVAYR